MMIYSAFQGTKSPKPHHNVSSCQFYVLQATSGKQFDSYVVNNLIPMIATVSNEL